MEIGIVFAGFLVVVGLLMESWPEINAAIIEGRLPNLTVTGGVIVTVGVLIEVVLGIFITQRANRTQAEANDRVALAQRAAAEANERAATLEKGIADARERAATLEVEAASLKLKIIELGPRTARLYGEGRAKFLENIKPFDGQKVDVRFNWISAMQHADRETMELSLQIFGILKLESKWNPSQSVAENCDGKAIWVKISETATQSTREAADALCAGLTAALGEGNVVGPRADAGFGAAVDSDTIAVIVFAHP